MNREELLQAMDDGAKVLTGNARLSKSLMAEYEQWMLQQGREAWPTPAVLPWNAWLLDTWEEATLVSTAALPRMLTREQETQVWEAILRDEGIGLLRPEATARRVQTSWQRVQEWLVSLSDVRFGDTDNSECFKRWAEGFRTKCRRDGFVSESEIPALLAARVAHGIKLPAHIVLAGFYVVSPAQQKLLDALEDAGCEVRWVEPEGREGKTRRFEANDARHEMSSAIRWARQLLSEDPRSRIGIVVPELSARRPQLAHMLAKILDPVSFAPGNTDTSRPWNLSLGRELVSYPVVRTALGLLSLMTGPVKSETLGVLLASPHWGLPRDQQHRRMELCRRALLDQKLRRTGEAAVSLASLHYQAGKRGDDGQRKPWTSDELAARLDRIIKLSRDLPARAGSGDWAVCFAKWLTAAGWAQGRPLDSEEFQAVEAWKRLLSGFSSLDGFAGSIDRAQALALLGRMARETIFQPRSGEAGVQVLGIYEANGLDFDHLWVMGMHDSAWPPAASPDPFIPLALQRELSMPNSDPDGALELAAAMIRALKCASPDIVFSHPGREGDGNLVCSPMIGHLPIVGLDEIPQSGEPTWQQHIGNSGSLEEAPPVSAISLRNPEVSGGSRILRNQAACPFRAFAEHRLGAIPLDRRQVGLGPMRRGSLLHRTFELLWRELESQAGLLQMANGDLAMLVRSKIGLAIEEERRRSFQTLTARFSEVEAERLERQVLAWLEIEKQRSPFTVVGFEQQAAIELGGFRLRVFIDRIDEIEEGGKVIVDYKTGKIRPLDWFGDRPGDPQLPLYSIALADESVAAVAFGQVRWDSICFKGVVSDPGILPGLPASRTGLLAEATENWPDVLSEWSGVLQRLACEFAEGTAEVDPRDGLSTCEHNYCELAPLCRVREREDAQ